MLAPIRSVNSGSWGAPEVAALIEDCARSAASSRCDLALVTLCWAASMSACPGSRNGPGLSGSSSTDFLAPTPAL